MPNNKRVKCMLNKHQDESKKNLTGNLVSLEEKTRDIQMRTMPESIGAERDQEKIAILKAAVNIGDSLIWEYDVQHDLIHVDYDLNEHTKFSRLRIEPFRNKEDFLNAIHPDDRQNVFYDHFERLIRGEIKSYSIKYRRIFEGQVLWVEANVQPYRYNADGTPSCVVYYLSDITKEYESEMALVEAREADRLKSAFLANMSHEIRTPLNAIVGFSSLLVEADNHEERDSYMEVINKNNALLLQLVDDILDFSKIESGKMNYNFADADLKGICMDAYNVHAVRVNPGVELVFNFEHPSLVLHTDEQRIMQVLFNFLSNAIKFTKKGSITISYKKRIDDVYVSVADTGIGISAEDCRIVFNRFVKLDSFQQGTGLGLAICKMIIEFLGGQIGVASDEGKGSVFWFTLPLSES